ncbi:hypothetical protein SAMN05216548_11334 [Faunimonas pinastri]|uniref:Uncharacterized protein n=1 Tax=Faunimonas pinastri TaxID=1855383 RepID=A0A1H9MAJ0_9HYPH|nr:hypothetical protein [Faunimonas pinastri]SER20704.1 hypothetical protein SAMN05216548_11334 [Faunimonas pinastri]
MSRTMIRLLAARVLAAGLALGALTQFAEAANNYPLPAAPDCKSIMTQAQGRPVWRGEFSGRRETFFNERLEPVYEKACFTNEFDCRRWLNETQSVAELPGLMSCKLVGGAR